MSNDLKCPICGEPTNVYMGNARKDRLCRIHAKMLKEGLIYQCSGCGKWNDKDVTCECKQSKKEKSESELTCIICGEPSNGKHFCLKCWKEIMIYYKDITHLVNIGQAKEYYYNLKNSIYWMNRLDFSKEAVKKLYAIAMIVDELREETHNSNNITQQQIAIKDIKYLLMKKIEYIKSQSEDETNDTTVIEHDEIYNVNPETADYRRMYPATIRCKDGHYVRSNNEKTIDDRLYEKRVFHEYETRYKAIDGQPYYPDFYIPDANLYIEYFGVSENKEKNNKKKELFLKDKSHKFEFITQEQVGILDDVIYDIIEKYKLNKK